MAFLKIPHGKSTFIGNFAFVWKPMRAKKNAVRYLRKIRKYVSVLRGKLIEVESFLAFSKLVSNTPQTLIFIRIFILEKNLLKNSIFWRPKKHRRWRHSCTTVRTKKSHPYKYPRRMIRNLYFWLQYHRLEGVNMNSSKWGSRFWIKLRTIYV